MLTYPDVFSSEGTLDENGKMNFYTLWDTGMLFWIESNESGWTTDAFWIENARGIYGEG